MNEKVSKEDQDWLDTLSGKLPEGIDPLISAQASAVRKALASRRESIEADAIRVGDSGLNEIRARLQREGLMDSPERNQVKNTWWVRALDIFGFGSRGPGVKRVPIWRVAAMLMIGVVVTFQVLGPQTDESLVYRGDPNATTLFVDNPELRANEIVAGIKAVTVDSVEMNRFKDGRIQLKSSVPRSLKTIY